MKRRWTASVLLLVAVPGLSRGEPLLEQVDVFTSGADGYNTFRIPAIETAPDGSLIALAEGRKLNSADPGFHGNDIDLVCKRSIDGGKTWSAMTIIEDPGELWSAANAATVVDRANGRVWILYARCRPGRSTVTSRPGTDDLQTLARYSDDNGVTWSEPIDLTKVARDFADKKWRASIIGPGGAIQAKTGRLIAPVWKAPYNVFAIYSDDHGNSWQRGQFVPGGERGDENQVVELADGRILMDSRQTGGPQRFRAASSDGGVTFAEPTPGEKVSPVACAIERFTLKSAGDDRNRIIWTGPTGPGRKNLVVRASYDEGQTFPHQRMISEEAAAYSDLTILKDKTVGVLWERGGYKFITFTRFNLQWLEPTGP